MGAGYRRRHGWEVAAAAGGGGTGVGNVREGARFRAKDGVTALAWVDAEIGGGALGGRAGEGGEGSMVVVSLEGCLRVVSLGSMSQVRSCAVGQLALSSVVAFPGSLARGAGGGVGAGNAAAGGAGRERLVAVGSWDCSIYVVSLEYGRIEQELRYAIKSPVLPMGDALLCLKRDLLTLARLSCGHDDAVSSLAMARRGTKVLVSGSWDAWVKVWAPNESGMQTTPLMSLAELDTEVKQVAVSDDGGMCAGLASNGFVSLWDVRSGTEIRHQLPQRASTVQFVAPGGGGGGGGASGGDATSSAPQLLAVASVEEPSTAIQLWDVRNLSQPVVRAAQVPMATVSSLHTDGKRWVAGTTDGDLWRGGFEVGANSGAGDAYGEGLAVKNPYRPHSDIVSCVQVVCLERSGGGGGESKTLVLTGSMDASACVLV